MRAPKAEKEDPSVVAAREREQARAEASRTEETQALLLGATQRRLRRFGRLGGSGGNVSLINPAGSAVGGVMGGGAAGSVGAGGSSGGGGGFGGGVSQAQLALY